MTSRTLYARTCSTILIALLALGPFVATAAAGPFSDFFVFGDSLSDVGNVAQATGSLFHIPGPSYDEGRRFSNGEVYAEALATGLGLGPLTHSRSDGNDFAHGGALTSGSGFPDNLFVRDVDDQVNQFLNRPAAQSDELFLVFAGANDLIGNSNDVNTPVNNLENSLELLIDDGARQFLVPNLPPLGYTPRFNGNESTITQYNTATTNFNAALEGMLAGLETTYDELGVAIHRFDVAALFDEIRADPASFGLTNVTDPAAPGLEPGDDSYDDSLVVDNQDEYLFWDELHPTRVVHAIFAERMLALFVLPGDFNNDNVVDAADYAAWRDGLGTLYTAAEYDVWREHFGDTFGSGAGAGALTSPTVPEPTTGTLLLIACVVSARGLGRRGPDTIPRLGDANLFDTLHSGR